MYGTLSKRPLVVILAVAVILRVASALYQGDAIAALPGIHDQFSYDALAQSILVGHGYSFDRDWYPFTPAHTPTAHWSFLYPLYLAGVYVLFGSHPLAARLIQGAVSGVLSAWLLYRLGRRLFDKRVGLVTAALSAVYIYFIYYDAALVTEPFYILGVLAMLDLVLQITHQPSRPVTQSPNHPTTKWVWLGLVLGVTTLLRQSILPWVPFLLGWMLWAGWGRVRWWQPLVLVAILTLFIVPWTVRNYAVYDDFVPLNSNAGYALYSANHPDHGTHFMDAYAAPLPPQLKGLNEAQLNSSLMIEGIRFILQDPARYLLLSLSRVLVYFKFWPSPESQPLSNVSRVLSFGLYLPFFLYGLLLSRRNWRRCSLLYLFGIVYSLMHILTWAMIRYRLPVDAAFMPFAALAVVDVAQRIRSRLYPEKVTKGKH